MASNILLKRMNQHGRPWLRPGVAGSVLVVLLASVLLLLGLPDSPASAQVKTGEYTVSDSSSDKLNPSVNGNIVVWEDSRDNLSNIYGKNLSTGEEFLVSSGAEPKRKPVTNGKYVVWEEVNQSGDSDIYAKNLSGGEKFLLPQGETVVPGDQRKPSISGNIVVWESKNSSGGWDVYKYDLASPEPVPLQPVITGGSVEANPVIGEGFIVWQDNRNGTSNIYVKNLSTGEEFPVSAGDRFQDQPAISGGFVVWRQESVGNYDIFGRDLYAKDLETGKVFQVTTDPAGVSADQVAPAISGTVVVWQDNRNGKAEVWAKDLATAKEYQVAPGSTSPQTSPTVSGGTIVWESQYQGDINYGRYDIHGAEVDPAPAAPLSLKAAGSLTEVTLNWSASTEADLAGYNVYRSGSANGPFVKLNQSLLSTPSFSDAGAPKGVVSYYRIMTVDAAGNESLPARTNAAAIARSSVSLTASPAVLEYGAATTLFGELTAEGKPLIGKQVILEQKPAGASNFSAVPGGTLTTAADGTFKMAELRPKKNTSYRVSYAGEKGIQSSTAGQAVRVRAKVSLSKPKVTRNVSITGRVDTTRNGKVSVVIQRDGKVISRTTVRLTDYSYRLTHRLNQAGKYKVQVIVPKTDTNLGDTVTRSFSR